MNLGIERFLILGCIAVAILELPQILEDLRHRDGYPAFVQAAERALAADVAASQDARETELLARLLQTPAELLSAEELAFAELDGAAFEGGRGSDELKRLDDLLPAVAGL